MAAGENYFKSQISWVAALMTCQLAPLLVSTQNIFTYSSQQCRAVETSWSYFSSCFASKNLWKLMIRETRTGANQLIPATLSTLPCLLFYTFSNIFFKCLNIWIKISFLPLFQSFSVSSTIYSLNFINAKLFTLKEHTIRLKILNNACLPGWSFYSRLSQSFAGIEPFRNSMM